MTHIGHLVGVFVLVVISALFSLSETALFSLNRIQVLRIRRAQPAAGSLIFSLLQGSRRTLTTILVGNNLVNVMAAALVTTWAFGVLGAGKVWFAIAGFTVFLIIFGEIIPKLIAVQRAEQLAPVLAWPLEFFARLTFPIRRILRWVTDPFLKTFLKRMVVQEDVANQEELRAIVSLSTREGMIDDKRGEMIDSVFGFGQRPVKEIMTPRTDLVSCSITSSADSLIDIMRKSRRSHILIYRDQIDQMVGFVSTRAFLLEKGQDFRRWIRPLHFVPETQPIDDLLSDFENRGLELAVVVDEYGGTAGLVTREDILEEVVGEMYDEFESPEEEIVELESGRYEISGKISVRAVNERLGLSLPEEEDVETLAGVFLSRHGKIPREGDTVEIGKVHLTVKHLIGRRIATLVLNKGSQR